MTALARGCRQLNDDMGGSVSADVESLYQLRHQTKNLLQAITLTLADTHARTPTEIQDVVESLIARVHVTAAMSDVLFGATRPQSTFEVVLRSLCESVVLAFGHPECRVVIEKRHDETCPTALQRVILRAAHEMVGNAVKHGWHNRERRDDGGIDDFPIRVRLRRRSSFVALIVRDGGAGFPTGVELRSGGGSRILDHLAREVGGRISRRNAYGAVVRLVVPVPWEEDGRSPDL